MRMADKPERTPADLGTTDPTFVYRNEITRLKQKLADAQAMIKHHKDRADAYSDALAASRERIEVLKDGVAQIECDLALGPYPAVALAQRRAAALLEKS